MKTLIVGGIHGDELTGIQLANYFRSKYSKNIYSLLAHDAAVKRRKRYLETDLNRSFNTSLQVSIEEQIAKDIKNKIGSYNLILDFHNTNAKANDCCITTTFPNLMQVKVCSLLGFHNLVIMPPSGSLISINPKISMSIEISKESLGYYSRSFLVKRILNLEANLNQKQIKHVNIFKFEHRVYKSTVKRLGMDLSTLTNFRKLSVNQLRKLEILSSKDLFPIFIGNSYTDGLAFILVSKYNKAME